MYTSLGTSCINREHYGKPREDELKEQLVLFEQLEFQILGVVGECNKFEDPVAAFRYYIAESDRMGAEAKKKAAAAENRQLKKERQAALDAAAGFGTSGTTHDEEDEQKLDYGGSD